jgi:hypothetical protein
MKKPTIPKKPTHPQIPLRKEGLLYTGGSGDVSFPYIIRKIGERYFGRNVTIKEIIDKYGEEFLNTISIEYEDDGCLYVNVTIDNPNYDEELKQYDEKMLEYNKQLKVYKQYEKTKSRKKVP